jgi:hypothetical protein
MKKKMLLDQMKKFEAYIRNERKVLASNQQITDMERYIDTFILEKAAKWMVNKKTYLMASEISECLQTVDLKIDIKHLKCTEYILIEYPENLTFEVPDSKGIAYHTCAIIGVEQDNIKRICVAFPLMDKNNTFQGGADIQACSLEHPTIQAMIEHRNDHSSVMMPEEELKYLLNCLVYLNSGNPDLRFMQTKKMNDKQKITYYKANPTEKPFDYYTVGFEWKKQRIFSTAESLVKSFYRWQPCGKGRTEIRLTFVREFVRKHPIHRKQEI